MQVGRGDRPPDRSVIQTVEAARRSRRRRIALVIIAAAVVMLGYVHTWYALTHGDNGGGAWLPNIVLGLPWWLVVAPVTTLFGVDTHIRVEADIDFACAALNVILLAVYLQRTHVHSDEELRQRAARERAEHEPPPGERR